ncbi:MAG TPA: endo-1,4-beta-xylanase [Flavisolibacter sp.]|nr:endo-1,4-beta-xylanase [Flavisolibacter sp.]
MMKRLNKITISLAMLVVVASCKKYEPLSFNVDKPQTVTDQESIDSLSALKTYINRAAHPNFKFGAAVSLSEYINKGVMYRLANSNFNELVAGYEMKHGAVVQADGSLALDNTKKFLQTAKAAGMTVYGHTLTWHANQNASYLNNLISPMTVTTPGFANALTVTGLQDGSFTGWTKANAGAGISVVNAQGMAANTKAIQLISSASSNTPEALQLVSPSIPVTAGHKYEIVCYIKSDVPGEGRIAFEGLSNNTPQSSFTTSISWKEVRFKVNDFTGSTIKLHFDLGYKPNVTYYIDINSLYVYDTQGSPLVTNLVQNGDFESGSAWGGWGGTSTRGITAAGLGYNGSKAFYETNPTKTTNYWDVQTSYTFPGGALKNGETYTLSFWVKGTATGIIRPELQSANYSSNGFGQVSVGTDWKYVSISTTATAADRIRLIVSYGEFAGTVYIDNVVLSPSSAGGTIIVNKTAAEKQLIITNALNTWITGMVGACKSDVKAWDVVNEPMDDGKPYELKTGVGKTLAADEFYWQDYLGKDYAVAAISMARAAGNSNDLLFINDYNLEYNPNKCRGLIAYVNYIESKGAKVDGIGTQMHISITTNKDSIAQMFTLLAATGKLIKISELDIGVGVKTAQATAQNYKDQADMYKYVIDKYFELIPSAQRYGITIWSPTDSPASSSWRAGEPIGIWTEPNAGYVRKLAYAAVADALKRNAK